ncbi:MAG: alpha/beta fold hydrolase, partial [Bacteroidota bacterium]
MKTLLILSMYFLLPLALLVVQAAPNGPVGSWEGTLNVQGISLRVVFHVSEADGDYKSTMDSPDQQAFGIPTDATTWSDGQLQIKAGKMSMNFIGQLEGDQIVGTFQQNGMDFPLRLTRQTEEQTTTPPKPESRPQEPQELPYQQESVNIPVSAGGHSLGGTLTLPADGKFSQTVILISGSGPQDRDEYLPSANHRPFLVLSDHLTRQGIAVLRYDDRGVGKSTGDFAAATTADLAEDAAAAFAFLQARPDMKGKAIGLMGHSEGGMIAPMVAANHSEVAFIGLLAAPGTPIPE